MQVQELRSGRCADIHSIIQLCLLKRAQLDFGQPAAQKISTRMTQETVSRVALTLPCMLSCTHILTAQVEHTCGVMVFAGRQGQHQETIRLGSKEADAGAFAAAIVSLAHKHAGTAVC